MKKTGLWTEPEPYYGYENDDLDYEVDLSTIDDMYSHHFYNRRKNQWHIILSITRKKF